MSATDLTPPESEALRTVTRALEALVDPERQARVLIFALLRLTPGAHALLVGSRLKAARRATKYIRERLEQSAKALRVTF